MPCILSVTGGSADLDLIEKNRSGLDLIFIVDISGSMDYEKINLVKITIEFVITILKEFDRVCIVAFNSSAYVMCPFTVMCESGKAKVIEIVRSLGASGGTDMEIGLRAGLHCLVDRRIVNQNTSVFMLSDGVDNNVSTVNSRIQATLAEYVPRIHGEFQFHTFGYGRDHDSRVMGALAENNKGNFYYIETESSVAEAFGNCLGELVSLVASEVTAQINTVECGVPFSLSKVYSSNGDTVFPMSNVFFNDKKDSVFVINFHEAREEVKEQTISPIEAVVSYTLKSGERVIKKCALLIEIAREGEEIEGRTEVLAEYYRVKGAETLKEVMILADSNNLTAAASKAKEAEEELRSSEVASNPKIQALCNDLADAQKRVASRNSWESGGRAQVSSIQSCHYNQRGSNNCAPYRTSTQIMCSEKATAYLTNNSPSSPPLPLPPNQHFQTLPVRAKTQSIVILSPPGRNQVQTRLPGEVNPHQIELSFGAMPPGVYQPLGGDGGAMNHPQRNQIIVPPGSQYPPELPGYAPMNSNLATSIPMVPVQVLGRSTGFGQFPGIPQTVNYPPQQAIPGINIYNAPPQRNPGSINDAPINTNIPPPWQ